VKDERPEQSLFALEPQYREKVWGGHRLRRGGAPVGESWVAFEGSRVTGGASAGRTVAELASECGAQLLGEGVASRFGTRFPLLVKLLDCADWLSVQVHPNDEQAARMVGPGEFGKSEAWHFLEADEGAQIIAGVRPGTTRGDLAGAIREGRVEDVARRLEVRAGETLYIAAGTLHALGPGLLLYEVQQSSDTTYRVYDWGRPAGAGRELHVEQAVAVTDPDKNPVPSPPPVSEGEAAPLIRCPFFDLDLVRIEGRAYAGNTRGLSAHVITAVGGSASVSSGGESVKLGVYETVLVAGGAGAYEVSPAGAGATVLIASAPAGGGREGA
jgi:mannose-6-phosphate isomerase